MARDAKFIRRSFGTAFLLGALTMLVAGETFLKGRLDGLVFIVYWLVCFVLTLLTIVVAFLDLYAVRNESREDQRVLIERTVQQIEEAKRRKSHGHSSDGRRP